VKRRRIIDYLLYRSIKIIEASAATRVAYAKVCCMLIFGFNLCSVGL
jgi:hypothetical protein